MGDWQNEYERVEQRNAQRVAEEERRKRVKMILLLVVVLTLAGVGVWLSITTSSLGNQMIILGSILSLIGLVSGITGIATGKYGPWTFINLSAGIGLGICIIWDLIGRKHGGNHD